MLNETIEVSSLWRPTTRPLVRDWSLITWRGGATHWEGGHVKFYAYEKGGGGKSFSHAEGGAQKVLG